MKTISKENLIKALAECFVDGVEKQAQYSYWRGALQDIPETITIPDEPEREFDESICDICGGADPICRGEGAEEPKSDCCNAPIRGEGGRGDFKDSDRPVTMHCVCTECDKPCNYATNQPIEPEVDHTAFSVRVYDDNDIRDIKRKLKDGWRIERADTVGEVIVYVLRREK